MRGVSKLNSRLVAASIGALSLCFLGASSAKATLIESWEGGLDGWQIRPIWHRKPPTLSHTPFYFRRNPRLRKHGHCLPPQPIPVRDPTTRAKWRSVQVPLR